MTADETQTNADVVAAQELARQQAAADLAASNEAAEALRKLARGEQ